MSTALSRYPSLCLITLHPVTRQWVLLSHWSVPHLASPTSNQLSVSYLLVLVLFSYWSAPQWVLPTGNCQWGTTGEMIHSRVSGSVMIWLLPLRTLRFLKKKFRNVFLVDRVSWVSLLNMRVEVSPTILVEETFNTFFVLMYTLMETVYWPWGNRLRILKVWGSLKLIGVEKHPTCS